jgi:hypothetical protein
MSTLGRGLFCEFPGDPSCGRTPFYSNDSLSLDLWTASGEPKEIFGFTEYQRDGAALWISIKYVDMETRSLDPEEKAQLVQFLDSVEGSETTDPATQEPILITNGPSRVRTGPGLHYADFFFLSGDTNLPILGRNAERTWWAVPGPGDGPGPYGWISAAIVTVQGDTTEVPILPAAPVPPTPWPEPGLPILGSADAPPVDSCVVYQSGLVLDEELPYVRSGPGEQFGVIGQLGRNRWAIGLQLQNEWFQITVATGETGWVKTDGIGWNDQCQPQPVRIQFAPGTSSTTRQGTLDGETQARYVLWAAAGQKMAVSVTSPNNGVLFHVQGVSDGQVYKHLLDGEMSWEGTLSLSQDYLITLDAVGGTTNYTLALSVVNGSTDEPEPDVPVIIDPGAPPSNACVASNPDPDGDPVYVYLGVGEHFAKVARLGNWAEVLQSVTGWHQILIGPGQTGWVRDSLVVLSGPCPLPQPAPVRVQFPPNATSVTLEGMLEPPERDFYVFRAMAGQRATIEIVSEFNRGNFGLNGVSDGQPYKRVENEDRTWSAVLPHTQDYLLTVAAPADAPTTGYRIFLTIEPLD